MEVSCNRSLILTFDRSPFWCSATVIRVALLAVFVFVIWVGDAASSELKMYLRVPKKEYVLREPIKFIVTLENEGTDPVNIVSIRNLGQNMEFMYYEIETPSGNFEFRRTFFVNINRVVTRGYKGEPVAPGDSVTIFLYPVLSGHADIDLPVRNPRRDSGFTFPIAGEYTVWVAYEVPSYGYYEHLGRGEVRGRAIYSNPVQLTFREPSVVEAELLDAYWAEDKSGLYTGDNHVYVKADHDRLTLLLDQYPDHEISKYILFLLARSTIYENKDTKETDGAIKLLGELMARYPNFRYEEVRKCLGTAYRYRGDTAKAVEIYNDLLHKKPYMIDVYDFMVAKIAAEAEANRSSAVLEWRNAREKGIKYGSFQEMRKGDGR